MSKAKPKTRLDRARAARDRYTEKAAEWHATAAARQAEADDLEARIGDEILDADGDGEKAAEKLSANLADLRAKADTAHRTARAAEVKVPEQVKLMALAAAEMLHEQAAEARQEADEHIAEVNRLLEQLRELEEMAYAPEISAAELEGRGPVKVAAKSVRLKGKVRWLERRASEIESNADSTAEKFAEDPKGIEKAVADADPDSPEAAAIADRKAEAERERQERLKRNELSGAIQRGYRDAMREVGIQKVGEWERDEFVRKYADAVRKRERLDEDQALARAEQVADECDRRARGQAEAAV